MSTISHNPFLVNGIITRDDLLTIINSGFRLNELKFIRQTVLSWLAAYPGDIYFNYLFAQSLVLDGKSSQAIPILELIENSDPEFAPAYQLHHQALKNLQQQNDQISAAFFGLTGTTLDNVLLPSWSKLYRESQEAFEHEKLEDAELLIQQSVISDPKQVLPAVFHVQIASILHDYQTVENLANLYHLRWNDCLYFKYYLASAMMTAGKESESVALLHQCVAKDPSGQVAARVWGPDNPYKTLWLEKLTAKLDLSIPQSIASSLGWNQLEAGNPVTPQEEGAIEVHPVHESVNTDTETSSPKQNFPIQSSQDVINESPAPITNEPDVNESISNQVASKEGPEVLKDVREELNRIATRLQVPNMGNIDRRFPVYVVFTTRKGLEAQYGAQTTFVLDELMKQVVESIRKKPGWTAILFYADDTACTTALGVKPAPYNDAWKLKLSISDLDKALSKRGEMIGSLLIVGGPEIVPFHLLPNPTEDSDTQVASDNPYASTDDNYFIPEWPVGRLPGGTNRDAGILMQYLRNMVNNHSEQVTLLPWWRRINLFSPLWSSMQRVFPFAHGVMNNRHSFGYTTEVWNQASLEAFRPIGDSQSMLVSPPLKTGELIGSGVFPAKLGYFNLHGVAETSEWYGQPDYDNIHNNPEYPVALTPADIVTNPQTPHIVFSEACYGAYIDQKNENEAISLKFLAEGTKSFVGSTCVSYGSVTTPLIAADKLAEAFWKNVKEGLSVGEALRNAKIHLAQEMSRTQGFLDGEDQKTLISFVLFGDPLAALVTPKKTSKGFVRIEPVEKIITTSESDPEELADTDLPYEVMSQVKSIVEQYLPGLKDARYSIAKQYLSGNISSSKEIVNKNSNHTVVTISKEYTVTSRKHKHYARLTFDGKGKVVKLAVSR